MISIGKKEERVMDLIDEHELVKLAVSLGDITAPSGYEQPMADYTCSTGFENRGSRNHSSSR